MFAYSCNLLAEFYCNALGVNVRLTGLILVDLVESRLDRLVFGHEMLGHRGLDLECATQAKL